MSWIKNNNTKPSIVHRVMIEICSRYTINNEIDRRVLLTTLGRCFHVPKELRWKVINELIDLNMLVLITRDKFLVKCPID